MIGKGFKRRFYAMVHLWCEKEIARIIDDEKKKNPDTLLVYGRKIYSQCDEDGLIEEIFRRIGIKNRVFAEIGCGCGLENNTHALLLNGWQGAWFDADPKQIKRLEQALDIEINESRNSPLAIVHARLTPENVVRMMKDALQKVGMPPNDSPDFISVDIDSYDLPLVEAMLEGGYRPRCWCVEYNAKFPPPIRLFVPYRPSQRWVGNDYQGASLSAWCDLFSKFDYRLAVCSIAGTNAFFVRNDCAASIPEKDIEVLYQPPRYYLVYRFSGHDPSLSWLRDRIQNFRGGADR